MTPSESTIFNQMVTLHAETRKLYSLIRNLTFIFSSLTFSSAVPYPRSRYADPRQTSAYSHPARFRRRDVVIASTCERIRIECEATLHQSQIVSSASKNLKAALDSYTEAEVRRGLLRRVGHFVFNYDSFFAGMYLKKRRCAYEGSQSSGSGDKGSALEEPTSISILRSEVDRGFRVLEYALKGLDCAIDGCKKELSPNGSASSSPSSKVSSHNT